ncbi:hypothetical protein NUW54_g10492 [Trametes sanguinea]|uniref:Uncharacterized protein n=1 Tax=Trametes sanguinea TaxID=158606 RepID=A0ACC1NZZ8_9APHY|nr:hypothetical protein NUW54_g10492 [Trametes sanguinea]
MHDLPDTLFWLNCSYSTIFRCEATNISLVTSTLGKMQIAEADTSELGGSPQSTSSTSSSVHEAAVVTDSNSLMNIEAAVVPRVHPRRSTWRIPHLFLLRLPSSLIWPMRTQRPLFRLPNWSTTPLLFWTGSRSTQPPTRASDGASTHSEEHPSAVSPELHRSPSNHHATESRPGSITLPPSPSSSQATASPSARATLAIDHPVYASCSPTPHPNHPTSPDTRDSDTAERSIDADLVGSLPKAAPGPNAAPAGEPNPSTTLNAPTGIVHTERVVASQSPAPPTIDSLSNHHATSSTSHSR